DIRKDTQITTFYNAYKIVYKEAMKCLEDTQSKEKTIQKDDRIHGGLLLLNELFRVADLKFENICQDSIYPYTTVIPKPVSYKDLHRARVALSFERTAPISPLDFINNQDNQHTQVQSLLIRQLLLDNFKEICTFVFRHRTNTKPMIINILLKLLPRLSSLDFRTYHLQGYLETTMRFMLDCLQLKDMKDRSLVYHAIGLMILSDKSDQPLLLTGSFNTILQSIKSTFKPVTTATSTHQSTSLSLSRRVSSAVNNSYASQSSSTSSSTSLFPCKYQSPDSSVFACITMIGESGPESSQYLDQLLEYLLQCELNHSLLFCLDKLCNMPLIRLETKRSIQQGLLKIIQSILTNPVSFGVSQHSTFQLSNEQIETIQISLQTLRIFEFEAQAVKPFLFILKHRYIEHEHRRIRIESIITITHLLKKLLLQQQQAIMTNAGTSNELRLSVGDITHRILTIGVTDLDPDVRYNVFLTLQDDFKQFLAKSDSLELLFFSVHDECHEIRELSLSLIGRLSNINPAYVLPPLRHLLLQLLTELEIGCTLSGKEQASRLLGQLIANTPRIVRPYMQSITQALLPLIRQHEQHSNVLIALVRTVGEQAQVCGIDFDERIHELFPILINMMQDTSNYRKREVALWTIGQIVESCCYVVEPLQKYPILLEVLLNFLKSEVPIPFRRETIRVLGFLGAVDPYNIRTNLGNVRGITYDMNDITSTHRVRAEADPVEISSNELLVASGSQSLHDFYTSMAIYVCLRVLKDPNSTQLHYKAVQSISIILQWLGAKCTQYVPLVIPRLLQIIGNADEKNLEAYIRQINIIIISIKNAIIPYVNEIIQLIRDHWDQHVNLQILLIQTIESLSQALNDEFRHYIHLLLHFVMNTFRMDQNDERRHRVLSQMFITLNKFGKTLKPHFNVVLPSILEIASSPLNSIQLRREALDVIELLAEKVHLSDYVSAILQILLRIIRTTQQLQVKSLDIICIIAKQMKKRFLVFDALIQNTMNELKLTHSKYELFISKLNDSSFADVQSESTISALISSTVTSPQTGDPDQIQRDAKAIYSMRTDQLRPHWLSVQVQHQSNSKDLHVWLSKLQQLVLEQSPVYPLRAMGSRLASSNSSILRDMFNAAFISCWKKLNYHDRKSLTLSLTHVLSMCDKPDIIQTILNLAEFRNHCDLKLKLEKQELVENTTIQDQTRPDQGGDADETTQDDDSTLTVEERDKRRKLKKTTETHMDDEEEKSLINIHLLSEKAHSVRAYAKALRYKEEEFQHSEHLTHPTQITSDIVESLISINHELQQSEAAYGALLYAKKHNIKIKGLWYEKLNQWEKALRNYDYIKTNNPNNMDIHLGRMRCMQALGSWSELRELCTNVWEQTENIKDEQPLATLPFSTNLLQNEAIRHMGNIGNNSNTSIINGRELRKILQQKIAPMATRAAWSLGDTSDMEKYFIHIPDTKFEGAFYRAVDAIRNDNFRQAQDAIDLARELLDVELTTLANESYNRAYSAMINAQLLSELEEVSYFKTLPERRQSICDIWQKRMSGNQPIIDDYHRLLLTHSLVLPMEQDLQSWIKLANLCCKSNRLTMADFIFKALAKTVLVDTGNQTQYIHLHSAISNLVLNRELGYHNWEGAAAMNKDPSTFYPSSVHPSQTSHLYNLQTAAGFGQQQQQQFHHPSLIDQQLVKYEKLKYDWNCLLANRDHIIMMNKKPDVTQSTTSTTTMAPNLLEVNRQDQLKLIDDLKDTLNKVCLPALDQLRKQTATVTSTGNIIVTNGATTGASTAAGSVAGPIGQISQISNTISQGSTTHSSVYVLTSNLSSGTLAVSHREQRLRHLISKCYLRLGAWQQEFFGMDDGSLNEIMKNFEHAWTYDENSYKAWNAYAVLNYDAVNYFKQRIQELSRTQPLTIPRSPPSPGVDGTVSSHFTTPPSFPLPHESSPTGSPLSSPQILPPTNDLYRQLTARMIHCTIPAVKGLLRSIVLSKTKHCLQNTLRLLTLWFEYGQYREVHDALGEGIKTVPIEVWLQVLPQLIARIDSPRQLVNQSIKHLLIDVGRQHPQALIYPLVVASKSVTREREQAANRVLNSMREHSHTLVQHALLVSEELIRISILWHERWHEALEEASRQYFGERSISGMIETLDPLHAAIERGSTTLNERTFLDSYGTDLAQARECIKRYQRTKDQRELHQAWDLYHQVFKRIHTQLPNITSLELEYVSPRLGTHCRDLELAVPGTYEPERQPITIRSVHSHIAVIPSKQRPRKISITGSDGYEYVFLLKGHEDLRQDERVMQLFGLVNEFLSSNDETRRRNFTIQRYSVIPLAPNNGLLGWVAQCDTFHALIKEHRERSQVVLNAEYRHMQTKAPHFDHLPLINKVEVFEYALNLLEGDDLAKILWHKSSSAEIWLDRRSNYTRSLAVMSMVGYILGLGDRHPSNLMLDRASGKVVHIDFGDCFELAMTREKFPEKIPFRLTRMLCLAMEVTGIDGTFRLTCEHVMDVLRKNRDSLMAVLEAFVHDPLLNWRLLDDNNPLNNQPTSNVGVVGSRTTPAVSTSSGVGLPQSALTNNPTVHFQPHLSTVNEEEVECDHIQQQQQTQQPGRSIRAVEIMCRVKEKLTGNDFHRDQPVDISTQVELLIKQATSYENLCQCYIGWCPFW
ncbi:unnamed protein product, partial [Didymodactylos carnosus]